MTDDRPEARYPYVRVDVAPGDTEEASFVLFELGAQGVEERDDTTLVRGAEGKVTLIASFATRADVQAAVGALDEAWSPRIEEVVGDGWRDEWKKYFRPFLLCPGVVVRPPWEAYDAGAAERVLELEPGRAFGTGLHETTSLVARALEAHRSELTGSAVLDVGCGSGILALVALALGASFARAIDVDADAVEVARLNAARNGASARFVADTTAVATLADRYAVIVANIEARVLVAMADALGARVAPGGLIIVSGILLPQADAVRGAFSGFDLEARPSAGEWVALVLRAGPRGG